MNYGKKIAKGEFLIYLNSGDEFFDNRSLNNLYKNKSNNNKKKLKS